MGYPGKLGSRGRESNVMDPSGGRKLSKQLGPREFSSKRSSISNIRSAVDTLDESRENMNLQVRSSCSKDNVVWMPSETLDGGSDTTLVPSDMLRYPPRVISVEITDRDGLGTGSNSELVFSGAPPYTGGSTVQTKDYKSGFPLSSFIVEHISITILTTGNNAVSVRSPVNAGNKRIVLNSINTCCTNTTQCRN